MGMLLIRSTGVAETGTAGKPIVTPHLLRGRRSDAERGAVQVRRTGYGSLAVARPPRPRAERTTGSEPARAATAPDGSGTGRRSAGPKLQHGEGAPRVRPAGSERRTGAAPGGGGDVGRDSGTTDGHRPRKMIMNAIGCDHTTRPRRLQCSPHAPGRRSARRPRAAPGGRSSPSRAAPPSGRDDQMDLAGGRRSRSVTHAARRRTRRCGCGNAAGPRPRPPWRS